MYYSITFGARLPSKAPAAVSYNTYDTWHLIPTSRPAIAPPAMKVDTIDIPGMDGVLDLSTAITGYPTFNNRTGSIEYIVEPGFAPWTDIYHAILENIHGIYFDDIEYEEEPGYFYAGRFTVNQWASDEKLSKITLDYDLKPYKRQWVFDYNGNDKKWEWFWDSFNFERDYIYDRELYNHLRGTGTILNTDYIIDIDSTVAPDRIRSIIGSKPVPFSIRVSIDDDSEQKQTTIHFVNKELNIDESITVGSGTYEMPNWILSNMTNTNSLLLEATAFKGEYYIDFIPYRK